MGCLLLLLLLLLLLSLSLLLFMSFPLHYLDMRPIFEDIGRERHKQKTDEGNLPQKMISNDAPPLPLAGP